MPAEATIALDLSRLLSRAGRETATGIDRVELAYAEHALTAGGGSCFAAISPLGSIGLLPRDAVASFVAETAAAWRGETGRQREMLRLSRCLRAGSSGHTLSRPGGLRARISSRDPRGYRSRRCSPRRLTSCRIATSLCCGRCPRP